jgi:methyl-accepting chemotaxis protein
MERAPDRDKVRNICISPSEGFTEARVLRRVEMKRPRVLRIFKGWSGSITFRVNTKIGISLLIMAVISGYVSSRLQERSLSNSLNSEASRLAGLLAASVAAPLFTFNHDNLKATADSFGKDPAIRMLQIKDPTGKVLAEAGQSKDLKDTVVIEREVKVGDAAVGSVALALSTQSMTETMKSALSVIVGREVIVLFALSLLLAFMIRRDILRPLAELNETMTKSQDTGDLTLRMTVKRNDEIGKLSGRFNGFMETLEGLLLQLQRAATSVTAASQQLTAASAQLSSSSQQQASSLEETAASLEEITGTVKQNADNARQANQLAVGSRDTAEKGGEVVTRAVNAMGEINKSSKKIADIITTIDEIAFQTNLLALNAAVEAARAGEQGRGFAVVAAEVRSLAQRSATAAKEIKALIQDSVQKVQDGSDFVNKSGQTLEEIMASVKRVTDIIGEIAAASQEQSSGIDQVNKAVGQMDQVVQSNAAQTEELSSTAQSLSIQAQQLQVLVGKFKLEQNVATSSAQSPAAAVGSGDPRPTASSTKENSKKMAPSKLREIRSHAPGIRDSAHTGFEEF